MSKPIVLIAEELSPATVEALGPDFEIRYCDGADRAELLPAIADVDAILIIDEVDEAGAEQHPLVARPLRLCARDETGSGKCRNAGAWGARRDVTNRLEYAVQQAVEAAVEFANVSGPIKVEISYDE